MIESDVIGADVWSEMLDASGGIWVKNALRCLWRETLKDQKMVGARTWLGNAEYVQESKYLLNLKPSRIQAVAIAFPCCLAISLIQQWMMFTNICHTWLPGACDVFNQYVYRRDKKSVKIKTHLRHRVALISENFWKKLKEPLPYNQPWAMCCPAIELTHSSCWS